MAHPATPVTPAYMGGTISFRRADGSRREMPYGGYGGGSSRRGLAYRSTRDTSTNTPTRHATGHQTSRYVSGYSHPCALQNRHEPLPRNVMRKFRQDNDEPAEGVLFVRESRQSVCNDGRDRATCSECRQAVTTTNGRRESTLSPQRVLRDLIMTDAGEPMRPALREALLGAFSGSVSASEQAAEPTFHGFARLPYEIRRMIWEAALPSRVLLREDLCQTTYHGIARMLRPREHTHTIEELWQSDLFHVCIESRRVVEALARGAPRDARTERAERAEREREDLCPVLPLMKNATTRTKLQTGLDVLYYPWCGSKEAQDRGGGKPFQHSGLDSMHSMYSMPASGSIVPHPVNAIPYGHWASQLRILQVPTSTVALDIAWLERQHPDTLAWAVGVDLSAPLDGDPEGGQSAQSTQPAQPRPVAPELLQVVLADIIIPVRIRIETVTSPEQKQLLQRHVYAQPATRASSEPDPDMQGLTNLNGRDFTVLVDLYDDGRIAELLSLTGGDAGSQVINKAALHRCIGCTRRAWEARSGESPTSWSEQFGALVGGRLQKICRPAILVSAVLVFDTVQM